MKKLYSVILLSLLLCVSTKAQVIVLQPDAAEGIDAYVSTYNDTMNYGTSGYLYYGGDFISHDTLNTFIKFDLSSVTPGTVITSARIDLRFMLVNGYIDGYEFGVYKVTETWNEDSITWANQPDFDTTQLLYSFYGGEYTDMPYMPYGNYLFWRSIYLPTALVQDWVDNPANNNGIVIKNKGGFFGYPYMSSSDWGDAAAHPKIILNSNGSMISGTVIDNSLVAPIPGLLVQALDTAGKVIFASDTTDVNGDYLLKIVYPGSYIVRVNGAMGYLPYLSDTIVLIEGQNYIEDVQLAPNNHAFAGTIQGTLVAANNPYIISNDLIISEPDWLTIEPGVIVLFAGPYEISVYGSLKALGNVTDSIIFTNFDTLLINKGRGIRFYEADSSMLEYCRIENMRSFDYCWGLMPKDIGGGVYSRNSDIIIQHYLIRRNFAQVGGGLYFEYFEDDKVCMISKNRIEDNVAHYDGSTVEGGAGMYITSSNNYNKLSFDNNLLIDNEFIDPSCNNYSGGGGLHVWGGSFNIQNNTFLYNNAAKGSALNASFYNGKILNNIFWQNSGAINGEQVAFGQQTMGAAFECSYNCIQDTAMLYVTENNDITTDTVPGIGNIYDYPEFADTTLGYYWLNSGSPCIDAGLNHYLNFSSDYQDFCRIADGDGNDTGTVDMGAFEYGNIPLTDILELGSDYALCFDTANILTVDPQVFDHYSWNTGDTTSIIHTPVSGVYSVTVNSTSGCVQMDSVIFTSNELPVVNLGNDTTFCGEDLLLDAGIGFNTYLWSDSVTTQTNTITASGSYFVFVTDMNGCSNYSDTMYVDLNVVPFISLPDTSISLTNGSVMLDAGAGYANYEWSSGESTQLIIVFGNYLGVGTHTIYVTVTSQDGCVGMGESVITVYNDAGLNEIQNNAISVFPNPADDMISVYRANDDVNIISIMDNCGSELMTQNVQSAKTDVNISRLSPGVYYLRWIHEQSSSVIKFVKL